MSCSGEVCGCCAGTAVETPVLRANPPGLPAVPYRAGTWGSFRDSMLARLSSSSYPALAGLRTRETDDFTIALLDATAMMLDVLTFYQERLANESYLRTATQLRSLTELSRLIGYRPAPGVAASAYVAFTLRGTAGAAAITVPAGTQMQSVPTQGQVPQSFETAADVAARAEWSALPVMTSQPWVPTSTGTGLYLDGTATLLQPGDALLLLGARRESWPDVTTEREAWDVVVLTQVQVDPLRKHTFVGWGAPLPHAGGMVAATSSTARVFALRQKAALFGHNAPSPYLFVNPTTKGPLFPQLIAQSDADPTAWSWKNGQIPSPGQIDLAATYPRVVAGGWFAMVHGTAQLFRVQSAHATTASGFTLSSRVTELVPDWLDTDVPASFPLASTEVLAQSEELAVAPQPLAYPLYGSLLDLQDLRPDMSTLQAVAVFGKRQRIAVAQGVSTLSFQPGSGGGAEPLVPGDTLTLIAPPPASDWTQWPDTLSLSVADGSGRTGSVLAAAGQLVLAPSGSKDAMVSEFALVSSLIPLNAPYPHTQIQLAAPLVHCYDRTSTTVNANVALATHGRSVTEFLGSGQAAVANQSFSLKQAPLTYTQAPTATGRQSSLEIRVNGVAWTERPTLFGTRPAETGYATLNQPDGTARVLFGDGVEGAPLPSGQNNLIARYRTGLGVVGNLPADTLTTLVDRPLGVSGVTNPAAATGGQDAESAQNIRSSAPRSVLTLGRAVSLSDYEGYAASFAGIAKARAVWLPAGTARGVFLTVAAAGGAALPASSPTLVNLVASLQSFGSPLIPITAVSFRASFFRLEADLQYDRAYVLATVRAQVLASLTATYSFDQRSFGQGVSADELASVIQNVPGVVAVNVTAIRRSGQSMDQETNLTRSTTPLQLSSRDAPSSQPAELLILDPAPSSVNLGVMS